MLVGLVSSVGLEFAGFVKTQDFPEYIAQFDCWQPIAAAGFAAPASGCFSQTTKCCRRLGCPIAKI